MSPGAEEDASADHPDKILFYDGVCGLCNKLVQRVVAADTARVFRYAPLQGETAARLRERYPDIPGEIDTMVYLEHGEVYTRAHAVMRASGQLGFPYRVLSWFQWLPRFLVNPVYNLVAKTRYRLFGQYDECKIPSPEERQLFMA